MRLESRTWRRDSGWTCLDAEGLDAPPGLVMVFAGRDAFAGTNALAELASFHPGATMVGCTTAGEIDGTTVSDGGAIAIALTFDRSSTRGVLLPIAEAAASYAAGRQLADLLTGPDLRHVLVFSDGLTVNGSELARGLTDGLPPGVRATGGLAADGERFQSTAVAWAGEWHQHAVAAVGFYGTTLEVGHASLGGWDPFGPERLVTRSTGNVLYELDGRSALELYKEYLGEYSADLPATGLLFPLSIRSPDSAQHLVRTLLGVDDAAGTMTFAGDIPVGCYARLMKANFDRLIDGARGAAQATVGPHAPAAQAALLISCVGRRMVLQQRTEEELEAVRNVLGDEPRMFGFYSYGELSPLLPSTTCELHNQSMTITTFRES